MRHVHVLIVAPLGTSHMAQPGTDQHKSGIAVRETANHTSAAADLSVQPLNDIVGTDMGPVLAGEITVGQGFLNTVLNFFSGLLQPYGTEFLHHRFSLLSGRFLALLGMDRLEHLGYQLRLGARCYGEHVAVEVDGTALVFGLRKHFAYGLQHTKAFVTNHQFNPVQATVTQLLEETDPAGFVLLHFIPSAAPRTSRYLSSLTAIGTRIATFSSAPPQLRRR